MTARRISVIMVDGSFREYFHAIRFFGDQTLPPEEYELIWIEFYQNVKPELRAEIEKFPNFKIITLGNRPDTTYHSSYCFNRGIVEAQADLIAIPDADVIVEPHFLERVCQEHATNDKLVMYLYRFDESEQAHRDDWTLEHLKSVSRLKNPSNFGGCLTVRKTWLLAINGYEQHETFRSGFHANGRDINYRLKLLGLHVMWHPELYIYHPWHTFTSTHDPIYQLQHAMIEYRARHFISQAFEGIDPAQNTPMPNELVQQLAVLDAQTAHSSLGTPSSADNWLKQVLKRLLGRQ